MQWEKKLTICTKTQNVIVGFLVEYEYFRTNKQTNNKKNSTLNCSMFLEYHINLSH